MSYYHTQVGRFIIFSLVITSAVVIPLLALQGQFFPIPIIGAVFIISAVLFSRLTIEIRDGELKFWFGIGLIRKRIQLSDITSCKSTTTTFLSGWGIHLTLRGWLYNVSGFKAVEITLKNGKTFLLGTDEPNELAAAVNKAIGGFEKGRELR